MIPPHPTSGHSPDGVGRGPDRLPIARRAPGPEPDDGDAPLSSHPSRCSTFPAGWVVIIAALLIIVGKLAGDPGRGTKPGAVLHAGAGRVLALAFDGDNTRLAAAVADRPITRWAIASTIRRVAPERHAIRDLRNAFSPDAATLACANFDASVAIRDVETGRVRASLPAHVGRVCGLAFGGDGTILASADDLGVRLWDADTGRERASPRLALGGVRRMAFSPDGRTLALGRRDGTIVLWDRVAGRRILAGRARAGSIKSLDFSDDGRVLASSDDMEPEVRLWDASTGLQRGVLRVGSLTMSIAFAPGGSRTIATGSADGTVRLWDAPKGRGLGVLKGHESCVRALAFTSDGRVLASGDSEGVVRLWDLAGESTPAER